VTVKNILNVAAACLTLAAAACSVVIIPPYVCGWLPEYPSLLDRVEYYWSPKAQFLKCNAVLHDIDAAKDAYELDHDRDACGASPTAAQIGIDLRNMKSPAFRCPAGGVYEINPVGVHPTCSIHGYSIAWQEGDPFPTRAKPAPRRQAVFPQQIPLRPEDRIEVPPPDEGTGID
jgi:hypothetical protein